MIRCRSLKINAEGKVGRGMELNGIKASETLELRPLLGLTQGLQKSDLEALTVEAIQNHRHLVDKADKLFHGLPEEYKIGKSTGGVLHLTYIKASIEMHAQMSVVSTLISILGYIPQVAAR
jgi:TraR antiactivator